MLGAQRNALDANFAKAPGITQAESLKTTTAPQRRTALASAAGLSLKGNGAAAGASSLHHRATAPVIAPRPVTTK